MLVDLEERAARAARRPPPPARPVPTYRPRAARPPDRVVPQAVSGRWRRVKWAVLAAGLSVYYGLPFLRFDRRAGLPDQAVLLDVAHARVYLFALEIRPQELYYLTGLMVLATILLVLTNAVAGRVWCGFLCPQTVWTDLFLLVERRIEGDRRERLRKRAAPLTARRIGEIGLKHAAWIAIAAATGGAFALYFVDAPGFLAGLARGEASTAAAATVLTLTLTTYGLAGFAREKVCTFMCPWPRLQGAVWDREALTVNYRDHRGEQRMSAKKAAAARAEGLPAGDCVDCLACVNVCPMGIDIRNGPSIACINCGLCVDACDGTMAALGRPRGLIDFETWANIERGRRGEPRRPALLLRPKTAALAAAAVALAAVMAVSVATRTPLSMAIEHDRVPLAVRLSDGGVRNGYEVRVSATGGRAAGLVLSVEGAAPATLAVAGERAAADGTVRVAVEPDRPRRLRVTVTGGAALEGDLTFRLADPATGETLSAVDRFHLP